jgi:hypothetical protein
MRYVLSVYRKIEKFTREARVNIVERAAWQLPCFAAVWNPKLFIIYYSILNLFLICREVVQLQLSGLYETFFDNLLVK